MDSKLVKKMLKPGKVDVTTMSEKELYALFDVFNDKMMVIYLFVLKYNDYINNRQNYDTDESLTMLEVHLLTDICDHPGSTVTGLAATWTRSVSATSQTIRKLIQKGLVTRVNSTEDAKIFFLHPTGKGRQVSDLHKRYDVLDTIKTMKCLSHELTPEEIDIMFKGLKAFTGLLKKK